MANRLPLAIFLSVLVLIGWNLLNPRPELPADSQDQRGTQQAERIDDAMLDPASDSGSGQAAAGQPVVPTLPETQIRGTEGSAPLVLQVGADASGKGAYEAIFSERGGSLRGLRFRGFFTEVALSQDEKLQRENWLELLRSVDTSVSRTGSLLLSTSPSSEDLVPGGLADVDWKMEQLRPGEGTGVRFTYGPGNGLVFEKLVTFEPDSWRIKLRLAIHNRGHQNAGRSAQFRFTPAGVVPPELNETFYPEPGAIALGQGDEEAASQSAPGLDEAAAMPINMQDGGVVFAGVHNKYFAFLMRGADAAAKQSMLAPFYYPIKPAPSQEPNLEEDPAEYIGLRVPLALTIPAQGESLLREYLFYAGPKDPKVFEADLAEHKAVLEADLASGSICISFNSIGNGLLWFMEVMHGFTGNWGMAIILLTLAVRLALFPINRRSQTAMARYQKKMKRVTPRINEVKEKYKNDPQKQREAQAKIMQEERAFPPLGGCLPMFLQLPVFFGLFSMLRTSFDLRQQPFYGWINDLSRPDQLARMDLTIPILGEYEYFNLLPILMVVMWILQQRGMPQPQDEQAARMQKMMTFMPIIFGFMLYNYAAGLSLYMLTSSTMAIFEQKVIKKKWPIDDTEIIDDKKSGCGPFSGLAEKLAEKQKEQMKLMQQRQAQQAKKGKKGKKR